MDERAEQSGTGERFEVRARLRKAAADTLDGAHEEAAPDESVERNIAGHDVPSRIFPGEIYLGENLRFDQRQLVAAAGPAERAMTRGVTVAIESAAGYCQRLVDLDE